MQVFDDAETAAVTSVCKCYKYNIVTEAINNVCKRSKHNAVITAVTSVCKC